MRLECYDFLRTALGNDEAQGRYAIYADKKARGQPRADNAPEAQRERQHAHDRYLLQHSRLPGRGYYAL